jgi:hypothetical protein
MHLYVRLLYVLLALGEVYFIQRITAEEAIVVFGADRVAGARRALYLDVMDKDFPGRVLRVLYTDTEVTSYKRILAIFSEFCASGQLSANLKWYTRRPCEFDYAIRLVSSLLVENPGNFLDTTGLLSARAVQILLRKVQNCRFQRNHQISWGIPISPVLTLIVTHFSSLLSLLSGYFGFIHFLVSRPDSRTQR